MTSAAGEPADGAADVHVRVETRPRLDAPLVDEVRRIVAAASDADGVSPLSEHVLLHLRHGGDEPARNVLLWSDEDLAAYAHLDVTDPVEGPSAELVVDPAHRGLGYGRRVVEELIAQTPDRHRLRLWAHGEESGAAELARGMGFEQMRTLWQMRRSLLAALPRVEPPPGVRIRTFRPGEDDEAWVALNNRAFAWHPEQGGWTVEDLHRRMAEPWFDPDGFFLAEREPAEPGAPPRLVGFHWTKVHGGDADHTHEHAHDDETSPHRHRHPHGHHEEPPHSHESHGHEAIGEVYVVGVDPDEQGGGLGRTLTVVGLRHLRGQGLGEAMLYVEADNEAAIRVYTGLGFTHWDTDRMFRQP